MLWFSRRTPRSVGTPSVWDASPTRDVSERRATAQTETSPPAAGGTAAPRSCGGGRRPRGGERGSRDERAESACALAGTPGSLREVSGPPPPNPPRSLANRPRRMRRRRPRGSHGMTFRHGMAFLYHYGIIMVSLWHYLWNDGIKALRHGMTIFLMRCHMVSGKWKQS